jgi:hypothetical protein
MRLSMWLSVKFQDVKLRPAASRGPLELPRRWKCAPFDFPELQLHCPWELSIFKAQAAGKGKMAKKNYVRKESYVRNLSEANL